MPVVEYIAPIDKTAVPADLMNEIVSRWELNLKGARDVIYARLMKKIPDETAFRDRIADASSDVWETFVSPYYPNSDFIKLKQRVKLAAAFPRWQSAVITAFQPGGIFETNVTAKRDRMYQAVYTLAGVGARHLGWGPIYKAVGAITGDLRITRYIGANETLTGTPFSAFPSGVVKFVRANLVPLLTQGAVLALYAIEAGLTTLRDTIINTVNANSDAVVNGLKSPDVVNVYVHLEYDATTGQLKIHSFAQK